MGFADFDRMPKEPPPPKPSANVFELPETLDEGDVLRAVAEAVQATTTPRISATRRLSHGRSWRPVSPAVPWREIQALNSKLFSFGLAE